MKNPSFPILLLLALLLSACSIAEPSSATIPAGQGVEATLTPEPSPSATTAPEINVPTLNVLPGKQPGDWRVVGLIENHSSLNLTDVRVLVTLLDADANTLASADIPITFAHLGSGEISPFQADFPRAGLATDARADLFSYRIGEFHRLELQVDIVSTSSVERGGTAILAAISNPGDEAASIASLGLLAHDGRGRALGLANLIASPEILRGGETVAALALLEIDPGAPTFTPYIDSVSVDLMPEPQPITLEDPVKLVFDDQGNPIVVGALKNSSEDFLDGSVLLVLTYHEAGVSIAQLETIVPLGPGEIRPFAVVDFPGLSARLQQIGGSLEDVEVAARPAPLHLEAEADPYSPLDLSIASFEHIGGFAFILGSVSNPFANPVQNATVMATLYDSRGRIITAGWFEVPGLLLAGASHDFVLPIPMPASINPRLSEFDIWSAGVQSSAPAGGTE